MTARQQLEEELRAGTTEFFLECDAPGCRAMGPKHINGALAMSDAFSLGWQKIKRSAYIGPVFLCPACAAESQVLEIDVHHRKAMP